MFIFRDMEGPLGFASGRGLGCALALLTAALLMGCDSKPAQPTASGSGDAVSTDLTTAGDAAAGDVAAGDAVTAADSQGKAETTATEDLGPTDSASPPEDTATSEDVGPAQDGGAGADGAVGSDGTTATDSTQADAADTAAGGCCNIGGQDCPAGTQCASNLDCVPIPAKGSCWTDADCGGPTCVGAFVCPCDADCDQANHPGACGDSDPLCCKGGGCGAGKVCVNNEVCKSTAELGAGGCWTSDDCPGGQTCQGANVCPCGAACFVADKAGTCTSPTCKAVPAGALGSCEMIVGWAWDGAKCTQVSGCGCGAWCDAVYKDQSGCEAACP